MSEYDPELGEAISGRLRALKLESPIVGERPNRDAAFAGIQANFHNIMTCLGLYTSDDSLSGTPRRVAKMFCDEIFYGLNYNRFPKCTTVENKMGYEEMITGKASVMSTCEHHFVPFLGIAWVSYIPGTKVLGLSKINRVVDFFSRRPQIQERLTEQIHAALCAILDTEDVAVVVKAKHYCVHIRGVKDQESETITSKVTGKYRSVPEARAEFLALTRGGN